MTTTLNTRDWTPLSVTIKCALDTDKIIEHVKLNLKRKLPQLMMSEAHDGVLAIAASGPSLFDTLDDLKTLIQDPKVKVMSVKSSHDWLIENGIIPYGCILLDGRPHVKDMVTPHKDVTYFVASMVHPDMFDALKDYNVVMWHAKLDENLDGALKDIPHTSVFGGSTSALRASNLGYAMGFRTICYFGLDSCFSDKQIHPYLSTVKHDGTERAIEVKVDGREFLSTPEMIGQAEDFINLINNAGDKMDFFVAGDGLISWRLNNVVEMPLVNKPVEEN